MCSCKFGLLQQLVNDDFSGKVYVRNHHDHPECVARFQNNKDLMGYLSVKVNYNAQRITKQFILGRRLCYGSLSACKSSAVPKSIQSNSRKTQPASTIPWTLWLASTLCLRRVWMRRFPSTASTTASPSMFSRICQCRIRN